MILSLMAYGQTLPYSWTPGTNPGWASSAPSVNTLCYQGGCYGYVSTSDCTGGGFWNTYNNSQITSYTSPIYNFSCTSSANVKIDIFLDIFLADRTGNATTGNHYDWLYFQYSLNGGISWINPVPLNSRGNTNGINLSAYSLGTNNRNGWTGNSGLLSPSFTIPNSPTLRFRFLFVSDGSVNTTGTQIYYADILDFTVTCPIILPVELLYFTGKKNKENNNLLEWSTASETNCDFFTLEKSKDAVEWSILKEVDGAGTTPNQNLYQVVDEDPFNGTNYYKLSQTDFDGQSKTFDIIAIENHDEEKTIIQVTNMMGQNVKEDYKGLRVIHYSDGSIKKIVCGF